MRLAAIILALSSLVSAQNWSGIIDPARAIDWSTVGATIDTTRTQCGATIAAYTGNANAINNALLACGAGHFVLLGSGTFNLSTGVMLQSNNVTLRGSGSNQTILKITGGVANGCHIGDGRDLNMCSNGANIGIDSADNTATWSAGYAKGTTVITLSGHANMVVGSTIWLDQLDFPASTCLVADGYPGAGDTCNTNWNNANGYARTNRGLVEGHIVTACGTSTPGAACTSNSITIDPPIMSPIFRSGQTPGAWWGNTGSILTGAGLENLTVDFSGGNGIYMINCTNCWITGVRTVNTATVTGTQRGLFFLNVMNSTFANNYSYGGIASGLVDMYGISTHVTSHSLFQNNIIQASTNPFVINSPSYGNVYSYNVFDNTGVPGGVSQSSFILHGQAGMELFEGNNGRNFSGDNIHGPHNFETLFRNHFDGKARNPSTTETQGGTTLYAAQRFFNFIGNVYGSSDWSVYTNSQPPANSNCQNAVYCWGWRGTSGTSGNTLDDLNVNRTAMRWWNWDNVTSTNDNGTNDQTGTRCSSSEVPSAITNYPNPVPATCGTGYPASFYSNSKPSWFGSAAWPPIGPDVTSGNGPNNTTTPTGGHANKIPARLAFEAAAVDPAYPSSSPRVLIPDLTYAPTGAASGSLTPTSFNFGSISVGSNSPVQNFTFQNVGTATLNISSIGFAGLNPGDFSQSNNCGTTLAISATCTVSVTFTPAAIGSRSASLSIVSDASNSPNTASVTGTGIITLNSLNGASLNGATIR